MRISIITVVFNNHKTIEDCIYSVQNQVNADIEHIIIDGNSTDGTREKIQKCLNRDTVYISEKDEGLYNALNKGIELATGEIIGVLHSDDVFYDLNVLSKILNCFENKEIDLLYGNGLYVDRNDLNRVRRIYKAKAFNRKSLLLGWVPLHTTIFAKKTIFNEYGLYDEKYKIASDYDITIRWLKQPNLEIFYLDEWIVKMRLGGKSTSIGTQFQKSKEDLDIIREHKLGSYFTLFLKIISKVPQYLKPHLIRTSL